MFKRALENFTIETMVVWDKLLGIWGNIQLACLHQSGERSINDFQIPNQVLFFPINLKSYYNS